MEHDLDTMAIAAATHRRQKQKATQKKADTESDNDLPNSKRSKESGGTGRDSAGGKGRESRDSAGGKGRDSAGRKGRDSAGGAARKGKRPREDVDLVSDDDMDQTVVSRHTPVGVSQIYKDWQGSLLDDVRRRFQTLMFARDGYPLKILSTHRKLNYKLAIRAANQIMPAKDYKAFLDQMDRAFRDSEKS